MLDSDEALQNAYIRLMKGDRARQRAREKQSCDGAEPWNTTGPSKPNDG